MRKKVFFAAVFLVTILFAVVGWAADWYVRPAGGNYGNEDGTSYENAWDGFVNMDWSEIQNGDTLWVCGTHDGEGALTIQQSNIEVRSYPSDPAYLKGNYNNLVIYEGYHDIVIDGLEIGTCTSRGMQFWYTDNLTLRNLYIHDTGVHGIEFAYDTDNGKFCDNITIVNSHFYHCGSEGSNGRALRGRVGGTSLVKNCIFEYCDYNGSSLCPAEGDTVLTFEDCISRYNGMQGFGIASNTEDGCTVIFRRCKCYGNQEGGVNVHSEHASKFYFEYCLFYSNLRFGLRRESSCQSEFYVYNNTIVDNLEVGLAIYGAPRAEVYNNIIVGNGTSEGGGHREIAWLDTGQDLTSDYNCIVDDGYNGTIYVLADSTYETFSEWQSGHGQQYDQHSFNDNPLLTSAYRLSATSPCIDAGIKLPIHDENWRDLAGNRQRYGTAPDIGCYEYKTWPLGAWGMLPWIGGRHKVQWTPYGE